MGEKNKEILKRIKQTEDNIEGLERTEDRLTLELSGVKKQRQELSELLHALLNYVEITGEIKE